MKAEQIIKFMESHYPLSCQEDWDHCGLQAGNIHTEVNKIMIGLDADLQTLQEAIDAGCHNFAKNTSIRAIVGDTDMTRAADVSRECGFDADIDKTGDVYVLLANLGDEQVLTVYVVDETIQLAFIQIPNSDSVLPISACGDAEPKSTAA